MTSHKHAARMLQYAQDWAETDEPWERWEVAALGDKFFPLFKHPYWREDCEYRRKPQTLTYTVTTPEPMREAPKDGGWYFYVVLSNDQLYGATYWHSDYIDRARLARGLIFATKEDAIAAAKAMCPFKQEGGE